MGNSLQKDYPILLLQYNNTAHLLGTATSIPRSEGAEAATAVMEDVVAFAGQVPGVLFQGYDSVRGKVRNIAVKGETQMLGSRSSINYQVFSDIEMVRQLLHLNLSLSLFGILTFGQKMSFMNNFTTYTTCIIVHATKITSEEVVTDVASLDQPTHPATDFFNGYGDSFVSTIRRGGEYCAVYLYYCETQEQQSELKLGINNQNICELFARDACFQKRLDNFNTSQKIRVSFHQSVSGTANDVVLPSAQNAIEFALQFSSMALPNAVVIDFEITGYENVPGMNSNRLLHAIARNRDFICGRLRRALLSLKQLQNDICSVEEIYKFYAGGTGACYNDARLMEVKREAERDMQTVQNIIEEYKVDPTTNTLDVNVNLGSLANGTPSLHYAIHKSPIFGGDGGNAFNDIGVPGEYLQGLTRISGLQLRMGNAVSLLSVTYTSEKNKHSRKAANGTYSILSGHAGTSEMLIPPGVFVISISGFHKSTLFTGPVIGNLSIKLSDGQFISGGPERGTPFHWKVPQGCFVLGFTGRFDWHVDQLAIIYASFQPAHWNHRR